MFSNIRQPSIHDGGGGTKFMSSEGMIVRGNEVHDNYGAGMRWDWFNRNARIYDNVCLEQPELWHLLGAQLRRHEDPPQHLDGKRDKRQDAELGVNVQLIISTFNGGVGDGIEVYENTIDRVAYPLGLLNHTPGALRIKQVYLDDTS